jgi:hypothetical protein
MLTARIRTLGGRGRGAHIEIVGLRVGRADVRHIGVALNRGLDSASAFGRAAAERIKANQTDPLPSPR